MNAEPLHDACEAFVLGALPPDEALAFELHLRSCEACRASVASYAGVLNALRAIAIPAPAAFPLERLRSYRSSGIRIAAIAAAAVLAVGLAYAGGFLARDAQNADRAEVLRMVAHASRDLHADRGTAHVRVLVGAQQQATAVIVAGLTAPERGRDYQVWIDGRSPGLLHRLPDGTEVLIVHRDIVRGAHKIGISNEPAGGSPARTTPSIIALTVARG